VLAPDQLTPAAARVLRPEDDVPVAAVDVGSVPYGRLRDAALAAAAERAEHERLRLLPRVTTSWAAPPTAAVHPPDSAARKASLASVTVVLPVRNRPVQVVEAIRSVQAQTHRDWQLVVVDDGSTDATPDVVAGLAHDDARITLVRAHHRGVSAARNLGAARATGEVLAWLDSDNTWAPDYLATMLAALTATGAESAYAVLEQDTAEGPRFRALDAGLDALRLQNHIDLNVLVARRAAVAAVGGFDPALRRAVDYDLVLRLAERQRPAFVPFVGAHYDERREASDRITVVEAKEWSDVVRARRLVDWGALGAQPRHPDRLTVVVLLPRAVPPAEFVPTVLDALTGADVEVVVVDAGGSRATGTALALLAVVHSRLRVVRWPAPMTPGWALGYALPHTTGGTIAVAGRRARLERGYDQVLMAGRQRGIPAVPVLWSSTGTCWPPGEPIWSPFVAPTRSHRRTPGATSSRSAWVRRAGWLARAVPGALDRRPADHGDPHRHSAGHPVVVRPGASRVLDRPLPASLTALELGGSARISCCHQADELTEQVLAQSSEQRRHAVGRCAGGRGAARQPEGLSAHEAAGAHHCVR
jgi:hypothetical protein